MHAFIADEEWFHHLVQVFVSSVVPHFLIVDRLPAGSSDHPVKWVNAVHMNISSSPPFQFLFFLNLFT